MVFFTMYLWKLILSQMQRTLKEEFRKREEAENKIGAEAGNEARPRALDKLRSFQDVYTYHACSFL